jgi:hypothetical protein
MLYQIGATQNNFMVEFDFIVNTLIFKVNSQHFLQNTGFAA